MMVTQVHQKFIIYIMINQDQKYRQLAAALENNEFEGGYIKSAAFFFKNIQHLDADILLNEIQISEQQRQITALEDKLGLIHQEQRLFDTQNRRSMEESSEEVVVKDFCCPIRDCGKRFEKETGVKIHNMLIHSLNHKFKDGNIFKLELRSQQNLS